MNEPARFAESVFERIAGYLPPELHKSYYSYLAHVRSLTPGDDLVVMLEGMAILALIARQVPEAVAAEREQFLTDLDQLCRRHETATSTNTASLRTMFEAHQKLLEQNIGTWQNREQEAAQALDRTAKRFEESTRQSVARIQAAVAAIEVATNEHRTTAQEAQRCIRGISLDQRVWPCLASAAFGALLVAALIYFRGR